MVVVTGTVVVVIGTVVEVIGTVVEVTGLVVEVTGLVVVVTGLVVVVTGTVVVVTGTVVVVTGTVVVVTGTVVLVTGTVVVVTVAHPWLVIVLLSRVTAPFRARRRPSTIAPVVAVMEVNARMVPTNDEWVPSVAELPTCQKTLQAWAPLMSPTRLLDAVMIVLPAWKMKTLLGSPWASRVSVPVIPSVGPL